jgi:hypothetical protein
MAGELQTSHQELSRLANRHREDPARAYCGRCGASVNTFGSIAHWDDCEAAASDIKFRPAKGK